MTTRKDGNCCFFVLHRIVLGTVAEMPRKHWVPGTRKRMTGGKDPNTRQVSLINRYIFGPLVRDFNFPTLLKVGGAVHIRCAEWLP